MTRRRRLSVVATTTIVLSLSPSPSRSFVRTTNVLSPPPPTDVRSMSFDPPRFRRRRPLRAAFRDDDDDDDVVRHRAMEALGGGGVGGEAGRSNNAPRGSNHPRRRRAANANHDDEALPPLPPLFDRGVEDDDEDDDRRGDRSSSSSSFVPSSSLEGVLPVSDLFYRPNDVGATDASAENDDEEHDDEELPFSAEQTDRLSTADGNRIEVTARERRTVANGKGNGVGDAAAARRTTRRSPATAPAPGGGRAARRSSSKRRPNDNDNGNGNNNGNSNSNGKNNNNNNSNNNSNGNNRQRRMIRRGMEMLVGGRPINADPPLRVVELTYDVDQEDWARVVTVNTRDFGPFLHAASVAAASYVSRGLFCEHFVANALKWKVCPDDLAAVVENDPRHGRRRGAKHNATASSYEELVERMRDLDRDDDAPPPPRSKKKRRAKRRSKDNTNRFSYRTRNPEATKSTPGNVRIQFPDEPHVELVERPDRKDDNNDSKQRTPKETTKDTPGSLRLLPTTRARDETTASRPEPTSNNATGGGGRAGRGFGAKPRRGRSPKQSPSPPTATTTTNNNNNNNDNDDNKVTRKGMDGQLRFALGVPASDLADDRNGHRRRHRLRGEANDRAGDADTYRTFSKIVAVAIARTVRAREKDHVVVLRPLKVRETTDRDDNVATEISVRFGLVCRDGNRSPETLKEDSVGFQKALAEATDEGDLPVNLAASVRAEETWSKDRRRRVSDELLMDAADAEEEDQEKEVETSSLRPTPLLNTDTDTNTDADDFPFYVLGFSVPPPVEEEDDDDDDLDFPFSVSSSDVNNSPYKGDLGPLLVDAVARRAAERSPKVIAVGDVHGCLDELQALLRECVYRPGDVVVFLGDLVSKGPDSVSVVRLAREIGALGVRGNHDFEVVRWHQAIASGADVPVARSEHCRIASALDPADLAWLHGLPWYLSSETLGALFVHAGFVSGVRLAKQNPRLMMNMRSVLPDGTVTSKFFNNWPWARLWDGPQTVFFGHDADRGLQQYDHAVGLDTGCVYGGRLTACVLPERRIVSVPAKRQYFKYRRRHFD